MSAPFLFRPIRIGRLDLANRIVIAPMCQYSAHDGRMTDWHLIHYGHLAQSGAAALTIEATAVLPEGRISYGDVGLWDAASEAAMARVVENIRRYSPIRLVLQLAHAGRKASTDLPWHGGAQIAPSGPNGWQTVGPSSRPFEVGDASPVALDRDGMTAVRDAFAAAAQRAARLGFDAIQLHGAHGYLIHSFLSPLSNTREDAYGGSLENRMRFPLEIFEAVREAFPADRPVSVRVSATDWVEGGWDVAQTIVFAHALEARGCSAINVSSGGADPAQSIPLGPGYQVPFARAIKQATSIPVVAVGQITGFDEAEDILAAGDADLVALARGMLYDPRWPWHAAAHFGQTMQVAAPYLRASPHRDGVQLKQW